MLEHPVVPFLVAAAVAAVVPRRVAALVLLAAPVVAFLQLLALDDGTTQHLDFFGYELTVLRLDDLSLPFAFIFIAIAGLAGLFGFSTFSRGEQISALLHAGLGIGVVLAGDLLTLFVMWELKAVASTVLIALGRNRSSPGAAYRYLLIHVLGGSLLLGGTLWHLSSGGSLAFDQFDGHASSALILLAFLLSAAMPPLHPWLPDAYPSASIAGTVVLSAFTTKSAVYALLRGFPGTDLLIVLGVAMAFYGVVYAVLENDVRRLLSYHIISQVGFMVTAVGIGTAAAVNGATAHAVAHILYKGLLLMGVGALVHATGKEKLTDMGGLARPLRWVMVFYMVGAFSISGVPLFSGFVSKELVIDAAYGDSMYVVVYLLKIVSVGTFLSTALKLPWFAFGGPDRGIQVRSVPVTMLAAMGITAAANVVLGLRPGLLYDLMPNPVDYEPFTASHLSETLQLLILAALGFWLLATKLKGEPSITLDTDWIYRKGAPVVVARAHAAAATRPQPVVTARRYGARTWMRVTDGTLGAAGGLGRRDQAPTPTPVLGAIMLVAILVLLSTAVISGAW